MYTVLFSIYECIDVCKAYLSNLVLWGRVRFKFHNFKMVLDYNFDFVAQNFYSALSIF